MTFQMVIGAVAIGIVGVGCYITGWLHGRGVFELDDSIGCPHCACDCEPDCSQCAEAEVQEMLTGKPS